jgi:hypothetical protein
MSKGWWKWQTRRPKESALRLLAAVKAQWRVWFPTKLSDDQVFEQLAKDVQEIQKHITSAFRSRKMFRDTTEMLQKHPTLSTSPDAGYWYEWFRTLYAHYIVMAVRRELDRGADAPNIYRLLMAVGRRPQVLSRARYKAFFEGSPLQELGVDVGGVQFTEMAGPGTFIDPTIVRKDLDEVEKQSKLVVLYANKIVAHRTPRSVQTTLKHVNDSLEAIEKVLQKYYVLLTGKGLMGAEPSIINTWQAAFTVAWIPPDEED